MSNDASPPYAKHATIEPIFHPQMRKTREVIRRPEWVKHTGEAVAHRGSLNSIALFGILFANCVGGGYGFEDGIGSAGPLITLIVCIVLPWLWALPTGLAVAELSTAVPSNSGVLMWANATFPPFISFLCILATIFITFIGNATYPSLTSEYVSNLTPLNQGQAAGVKIAVIVICCVLNCVGVEIVGSASIVLCAITILPFMLMTVIQLFGHGFNAAVLKVGIDDTGLRSVDWAAFFSIISWNYANIENAGAVVEEIANPRKALPRAMVMLMFGTYVGYVMPMLAGVSNQGINQDYTQWQAGHWPQVAKAIAGDWLKYMLFAGAMLSGVGFTITSMCCTSRLLAGMGTMQMFPKKISRVIGYYHPRLGTPIPAILINSAVTMVFSCSMDFGDVVSLCQSLYCMRMLVIYAAVIKLRIQYPKLPRPFALPCNTWVAALCLAPAAGFSLMCAIVSAMTSLAIGMAFVGFIVGGSVISWLYCRIFAKNGFQGVIVQCVVSEEDEEAGRGPDDGDDDELLDEGVFYHDGQDEAPGDLLLGILPMSGATAGAQGAPASANGGVNDGSVALGMLPAAAVAGAGRDSVYSTSSEDGDMAGAEYVAQEEHDDDAPRPRLRNPNARRTRSRDADIELEDIEIPMRTAEKARPATVGRPVREGEDDYNDEEEPAPTTSPTVSAATAAVVAGGGVVVNDSNSGEYDEDVVRKAQGSRARRSGGGRGTSRDAKKDV